jgi:hypothetical protein
MMAFSDFSYASFPVWHRADCRPQKSSCFDDKNVTKVTGAKPPVDFPEHLNRIIFIRKSPLAFNRKLLPFDVLPPT